MDKSSSARLLGVVTPLHFARLDLLVPSNSLRRLQNLHRMLGVGQISCTFNPSNGDYSYGALRHFFNLDPHNSSASSERFSNPLVLSVGRGVTDRSCGDRSAALDASFHAQHYPAKSMLGEEDTIFKLDYSNISIITL